MPIQDFNDKVSVCDSTLCSCINHFSVGVSHRRWPVPVNGCSCCYQATRKLYNGVVGEVFHKQSNQCNQCWLSLLSLFLIAFLISCTKRGIMHLFFRWHTCQCIRHERKNTFYQLSSYISVIHNSIVIHILSTYSTFLKS